MSFNIDEVPQDIADHIRATGPVEWGCTHTQDDETHIAEFANTLRLTREHFGTVGDTKISGVYLDGTDIVVAHTGTSPHSPMHARILVGLWNWMHSNIAAHDAGLAEPEEVAA